MLTLVKITLPDIDIKLALVSWYIRQVGKKYLLDLWLSTSAHETACSQLPFRENEGGNSHTSW